MPSPAPWIHALHLSRDSQAGTFLQQGSEMQKRTKREKFNGVPPRPWPPALCSPFLTH